MRTHTQSATHHHYRQAFLFVWLALTTSFALGLDPHQDLRQYGRRSWQTDSGLPQNTVHSVIQTHDGYIWLATEGGLVRFDGVQFVTYDKQAPAHLRSAGINTLFEASRGDLWIGTDDGLIRRRGEDFTTFTAESGLPSNTIWSVFQSRSSDSGSDLWVITPDGLARYRDGHFQPFPIAAGIANAKSFAQMPDGSFWIGTHRGLLHFTDGAVEGPLLLADLDIDAVATTPDGRLWAGTRSGLYSFTSGKQSASTLLSGLPSSEITALATDKVGQLWIATAKGIAALHNGAVATYTVNDGLPAERIESFSEDRNGAMWVATSRGLARIFGGHVQAFASPDGLASDLVLTIYEDREGSLWLGTESGGLEMLHDQKFTSYTTADGLSDDLVRAVVQDKNGTTWVGTNGGGLNRFDHGRFTALTTANGLSSNIVMALASDMAGDLWVGTPDGLNRIHEGRVTVFTSADGLVDDFVRSIYAASNGSVWIGTRRGLSHLDHGKFTNYSREDGLASDLVGAMVEDNRHALWIATLGGLSHLEDGKFTSLTMREGLTSNVITALYRDREGTLWIGTNQGGLNRLRDGTLTTYPPKESLLPENTYAILADGIGNLWLSSKTGIYRVSTQGLTDFADHKVTSISPTVFGTADGMKIGEGSGGGHPAAWRLANGEMWFATLKGVTAVDPEHLARNTIPPPVVIDEVLVDDRPVSATGPLTIPAGKNRFEFHYAGLSFIVPQRVLFRYRLDGFDHEWVDAGTRRTAYYTNLPPGAYRFRVLACNNDGVWNETGASLGFRLRPRFYQTYWFYSSLLLFVGLVAYCVYRWRVRQVELRFDAVLAERGRIAREIHDTLAQGLVGISVHLELVSRLLASSVESAKTQLDQARGLVKDSLKEARSSIWDLRSQAAETEDLATRLSRMAASAAENPDLENSDSKIKVKSRVSGTYRPLSPKTEAELLRIAQEAVTNAIRHANPKHVDVEVRFAAHDLHMTIQDDGCGFDGQPHPQSSGPAGHFGLIGMRERTKQIGGTLDIESTLGKGTLISVHVAIDG